MSVRLNKGFSLPLLYLCVVRSLQCLLDFPGHPCCVYFCHAVSGFSRLAVPLAKIVDYVHCRLICRLFINEPVLGCRCFVWDVKVVISAGSVGAFYGRPICASVGYI